MDKANAGIPIDGAIRVGQSRFKGGMSRSSFYDLWPFGIIFLFVSLYYYFFSEDLPWFWYDDIHWLEYGKSRSLLAIFKEIFNFTSLNFGFERPVLGLFMKGCYTLFGEYPHLFRITKLLIYSSTLSMLFYMIVRNGGHKIITLSGLFVLATFPSVVIVNTWVNEAATLELFFKVVSFILFFLLIAETEKPFSLKIAFVSALLILFVLMADKSKITAKTIPFTFLTYLVITKNRKTVLYAAATFCLMAIIPYSIFVSAGPHLQFDFLPTHLNNFLFQIWILLVFALILVLLTPKEFFLGNNFIIFSGAWLFWEVLFFSVYPSDEMRYLFSSLTAAVVLLFVLISNALSMQTQKTLISAIKIGFSMAVLLILTYNSYWSYNFRGSLSRLILADKQMQYINQHFQNTLCLYDDFTLPYYSLHTNNTYVNVNPRYASANTAVYLRGPQELRILNSEKYAHIIVLDKKILNVLDKKILSAPPLIPPVIIDSIIPGSFYDSFQNKMNIPIRSVSLYSASLNGIFPYPAHKSFFMVK